MPEGEQKDASNFTLYIPQEGISLGENNFGHKIYRGFLKTTDELLQLPHVPKLDYNTCASSFVLASHLGHSSQSFSSWRACLCALFSLRTRWNLLRGSVFASCFSSMASAHARSAHTSGRQRYLGEGEEMEGGYQKKKEERTQEVKHQARYQVIEASIFCPAQAIQKTYMILELSIKQGVIDHFVLYLK